MPTRGEFFSLGIFLNTGAVDNLIHANSIFVDDGGTGTNIGAGILFDVAADRNTVTSNTIVTTRSAGISMESGSGVGNNGHVWRGNIIIGAERAMVVRGDNNVIEDNFVMGSGGARLVGGSNNVLKNNVIELGINTEPIECFDTTMPFPDLVSCTLNDGITLVEETDTILESNTIRHMLGDAIVVDPSSNVQVLRNRMHKNGGNGLTLSGSPTTQVSLNDIWLNGGLAVTSDNDIELSVDGKGNWWQGNCGNGLFVPGPGLGAHSNAADVIDSAPYRGAISHVPFPKLPKPCKK